MVLTQLVLVEAVVVHTEELLVQVVQAVVVLVQPQIQLVVLVQVALEVAVAVGVIPALIAVKQMVELVVQALLFLDTNINRIDYGTLCRNR
jgi:hypothetical protein|tara:strand:+ start:253 stop:525 length:273 start_codon:yes stop_codon:yes gene_type:complete